MWHKKACHIHDICYSTCGKTQKECDSEFSKMLKEDCKAVIATLNVRFQAASLFLMVACTLPW